MKFWILDYLTEIFKHENFPVEEVQDHQNLCIKFDFDQTYHKVPYKTDKVCAKSLELPIKMILILINLS